MSSHLPVPELVPLKVGMTEDEPHDVLAGKTVGIIQAGLSWHLSLQTGLLDVLWLFMAMVFTVHHCKSPASPIVACGISELGKARGKQSVKVLGKALH